MSEQRTATHSLRVAQASGMVSVQAGCSIGAAQALMESRAQVAGQTLEQIATAIIDRRMTFG